MVLSRKIDYALRAVEYMSSQPRKKPVQLEEIAKAQGIPEKFLSKILQTLVRSGILESVRGYGGGYWIGKPCKQVTIQNIIEAVDGPIAINHCTGKKIRCRQVEKCRMHDVMKNVQDAMLSILGNTTLADIAR